MNRLKNRSPNAFSVAALFSIFLVGVGCSRTLPKGAIGNLRRYNYSPSVIESGGVRQFWWCSQGINPDDKSQDTDAIYYESVNLATQKSYGPVLVLAETPGAWDSLYTCNPKVIGGSFANPLGDGKTYTYAMYYVAIAENGGNNSIGVAFSNDGISWKKYPQPVVRSASDAGYGAGQPAVYNADRKSAITMFYEDTNPTLRHVQAVSSDGVHFSAKGILTSNGLDIDNPDASWGDMAYDLKTAEWYAAFNRPLRPPSTTGGRLERGQYGVELYRIPQDSMLTGASPWQQLDTRDTNATGYESNFIAGFVRDSYGNLNVAAYPTIQMYTSISYPPPSWESSPAEAASSAGTESWILMPMEWAPGTTAEIPLNRYFNGMSYEATTGWINEDGGFAFQQLLGHLYATPLHGADLPLYGCKRGRRDYFVSLDRECEGERILGKEGYGYSQPVHGLGLVALYRCEAARDHFVSKDPKCEGQATDGLLGYVLP